jgi:lipid-binding SYLF domain-containing protein
VAAGPIGRNAEAAATVGNLAAIFSYSKTKGLFAGKYFIDIYCISINTILIIG